MKNLLKALFAIFVLGVLFTGCNKDDDDKGNYVQVADTTYELSWGVMYSYGMGSSYDGYGYDVYLCSSGIDQDWNGTGDYINFEIASSINNGIASGTYTFHVLDEMPVLSYDNWSYWETGYETADDQWAYLTSGNLVVKNNGDDNYEFTYNGEDENGNTIKAHYVGSIENIASLKKSTPGNHIAPNSVLRAVRME